MVVPPKWMIIWGSPISANLQLLSGAKCQEFGCWDDYKEFFFSYGLDQQPPATLRETHQLDDFLYVVIYQDVAENEQKEH